MQVEHPLPLESFLEEVKDLSRVDWPEIWKGPPGPGLPGFDEWCSRYDWKPQTFEFNLKVVTKHGNRVELAANGQWSPVLSFAFDGRLARIRTSEPNEKREVVKQGIAEWKQANEAISTIVGHPPQTGAAGDRKFPESPVDGYWETPESSTGDPFRVSFWPPSPTKKGAVIVLTLGVSLETWEPTGGSSSVLLASFRPPRSGDVRG